MERSGDLGDLGTNEWDKLEEIAERFEQTWRKQGKADLTQFLPPAGTPLRPIVLNELIKTDMELRGRSGNTVGLAWVELSGDPDRLAEWLGGEEAPVRWTQGPAGVHAAGIATEQGDIVLA